MRVNELIGAPVRDGDGGPRRFVIDVRTRVQDGGLVVEGLVVGRRSWRMFGYEHRRENGPILLRKLIERLHRDTRLAPWEDLDIDPDVPAVRLRRNWDDLPHLPGLDGAH